MIPETPEYAQLSRAPPGLPHGFTTRTQKGVLILLIFQTILTLSLTLILLNSVFRFSSLHAGQFLEMGFVSCCFCFFPLGILFSLVAGVFFYQGRFDFGEDHQRKVLYGLVCSMLTGVCGLLFFLSEDPYENLLISIFLLAGCLLLELGKVLLVIKLLKKWQRQLLLGIAVIFLLALAGVISLIYQQTEQNDLEDAINNLTNLLYLMFATLVIYYIYEIAYLEFVYSLHKRLNDGELKTVPDLLTGPGAKYYKQHFIPRLAPRQTRVPENTSPRWQPPPLTGNEPWLSNDPIGKDKSMGYSETFRDEEKKSKPPEPR